MDLKNENEDAFCFETTFVLDVSALFAAAAADADKQKGRIRNNNKDCIYYVILNTYNV